MGEREFKTGYISQKFEQLLRVSNIVERYNRLSKNRSVTVFNIKWMGKPMKIDEEMLAMVKGAQKGIESELKHYGIPKETIERIAKGNLLR